ncbi:MAG: TetR/AcrR family transcriptional regulator [Gemmatimonadetes bacterium]|nr:TetR/AcrR family transcriptional regulator [Gemmatimonadota bacterium]
MGKQKATPRRAPRPKWTRRPDARPREILDAALRVFAKRGYNAARLDDIAAAAGVTKGTIYYYFKNKHALLTRLAESIGQAEVARIAALVSDAPGPVSAQLRLVMRNGFVEPPDDEDRRLLRVVYLALHADAPHLFARIVQRILTEGWALIATLIERGKATGEFRADADAETAARIFTSGLLLQQLWRQSMDLDAIDPFDQDRMVDSTIDLFLHSLRPTARVTAGRGPRRTHS